MRANDRIESAKDHVEHAVEQVEHAVEAVVDRVKPHLRGWLHAVMAPLAVLSGLILVAFAPTRDGRLAAAVFTITAGLLFGVSALYHRGTWSTGWDTALRRMDHANIFLIIAGSYTPFALLLDRGDARTMLAIVWGGAVVGLLFRVLWVSAPRWLYVPVYLALGWVAIFYLEPLLAGGGPLVLSLIALGGLLYTAGALVYGLKRPNPSPRWFGFHEVFHTLTILAFVSHYVAASVTLYDRVA